MVYGALVATVDGGDVIEPDEYPPVRDPVSIDPGAVDDALATVEDVSLV